MNIKNVMITPSKAKELLSKNTQNRNPQEGHVAFLAREMKTGSWKMNGETIVVSSDGVLVDGQHRLLACVKSSVSFPTILVEGVNIDVVTTIDTGKSRSLQDVLKMNGFKNVSKLASYIVAIHNVQRGVFSSLMSYKNGQYKISSGSGLKFAMENKDELTSDVNLIQRVCNKQHVNIITAKDIGTILAILKDNSPNTEYIENFLLRIIGYHATGNTATGYIYRTLLKNKDSKASISKRYLYAIIVKAWNLYVNGDPEVKYIRWDSSTNFPKVEKVL